MRSLSVFQTDWQIICHDSDAAGDVSNRQTAKWAGVPTGTKIADAWGDNQLEEAPDLKKQPTIVRAILTLFAGILVICSYGYAQSQTPRQEAICSSPAVVFCENFEDRTNATSLTTNLGSKTTGWALSNSALSTFAISTAQAVDGTKSLAMNYPNCSWSNNQYEGCGAGFMSNQVPFSLPQVYVRHYVRWGPGFVWSPVADKHMFLNSGNFREPSMFWTLSGSRTPMMLVTAPSYNEYEQNGGGSPLVWNTGQWYCLEAHVTRVNSTTANLEGWVDGVRRWNLTGVALSTAGNWDSIEPAGYWNTPPSGGSRGAQTRWMDNIVVSTQRIGCLNQSSDAMAPSAPGAPVLR